MFTVCKKKKIKCESHGCYTVYDTVPGTPFHSVYSVLETRFLFGVLYDKEVVYGSSPGPSINY